jgi:hypothetical protein
MLALLGVVGLASISIQLLIRFEFAQSALLYVAVPYVVAVLITLFRPLHKPDTWWREYLSHSTTALVIFLASSAVLFEGFICVLFFMPIYFLGVSVAFVARWIRVTRANRHGRTYAHALPILIAFLSLEGTSEMTTVDRYNIATATATTSASPASILANLAAPIEVPSSDDWMLGVFPMPVAIEAGSLNAGDVHRVHTRYHRWFFTNTHEGVIELRIDSVTPERVTATFVRDTSYFSSYVTLIGSEITISTGKDDQTDVCLSIYYERRLDPAWYFQPIQQYAMETMAAHLIQEVMIRD